MLYRGRVPKAFGTNLYSPYGELDLIPMDIGTSASPFLVFQDGYRERDSNPHGPYGPLDFKSSTSTIPPSRPRALS